MITKIQDHLQDWDHDNPSRPDSLTIFVSENGLEVLRDELPGENTLGCFDGLNVTTDPALEGSDVRVAPHDVDDLQPRYVEDPLVAHVRQCVFPEEHIMGVIAQPHFKVRVPCDEHGHHDMERRLPFIVEQDGEVPAEERIYREVARHAGNTVSALAVNDDGVEEELEVEFRGILIA